MFSPDSKLRASFSLISGGVSSSQIEESFSSILSHWDSMEENGSSRMTHWGLPGMFGWAGGMCMCPSVIRMPRCENIVVLDLFYE